jgi:uncharacterized damage-inducible protein DinB
LNPGKRPTPRVSVLLGLLDEAFEGRSWHGTNLRGSLRRLEPRQAAWRPNPDRHNIWEIVVHAAYWKYAVRRRISGEKRGSFAVAGSNWFVRPEQATLAALRADVKLLVAEHRELRLNVADLDDRALLSTRGGRYPLEKLIRGAAAHDLYHAGQIQLLKRLFPGR